MAFKFSEDFYYTQYNPDTKADRQRLPKQAENPHKLQATVTLYLICHISCRNAAIASSRAQL